MITTTRKESRDGRQGRKEEQRPPAEADRCQEEGIGQGEAGEESQDPEGLEHQARSLKSCDTFRKNAKGDPQKLKGHTLKNEAEQHKARDLYAAAYATHYESADLLAALGLYKSIVATCLGTREAEYARTQILNIANNAIPKQELFDVQIELALTNLERGVKESNDAV